MAVKYGRFLAGFLFFVMVAMTGADEETPATDENSAVQLEELRLAVEKLAAETEKLRGELEEKESVIRLLTQNLAVAQTESELFKKKWADAQLRAQTLGVDFSDREGSELQRQVVDSVRALYLTQAENERLRETLQQLLETLQTAEDLTNRTVRAQLLNGYAVLGAGRKPDADAGEPQAASLNNAQIIDVNSSLRLVVLDIGEAHGVRVGMPFRVWRNDRLIGRVRVVDVRRRICGALIEESEKSAPLTVGDRVTVTKS
jgi:hypothetical protein